MVKAARKLSCLDQAYRYLSRRDHSVHELRVKLHAKQFSEAEIGETVDRLLDHLDDARYCKRFAAARVARMRIGPKRLKMDLERKGFSLEIIGRAIDDLYGADKGEWPVALDAAKRKMRTFKKGLDKQSMRRKLYDHLMRRGFSGETARKIVFEELDGLIDGVVL